MPTFMEREKDIPEEKYEKVTKHLKKENIFFTQFLIIF